MYIVKTVGRMLNHDRDYRYYSYRLRISTLYFDENSCGRRYGSNASSGLGW